MSQRPVYIGVMMAVLAPAVATAQHEAHQAAAAGDPERCAQVQPLVQNIITAATARVESARQSNDPVQLRAAVASLDAALRDIRTQLAPCATAPTASSAAPAPARDPLAGHAMPVPPTAPKPVPPKTAKPTQQPDPHAGHGAAPAKPLPRSRPELVPPKAAAKDPHAGHAPAAPANPAAAPRAAPADKQRDPVTGLMVDPSTAPTTTYQGQTYYFSSDASKKEFLENPAKFARKR